MLKQLSDQDASFLYVETAETPAHVGSLSLVELPEGYRGSFFEDYKAVIASRSCSEPSRAAVPPRSWLRSPWTVSLAAR